MHYEALLAELQEVEKNLKDTVNQGQKYYKAMQKDLEKGDLRGLDKTIASLEEATRNQLERLEFLKEKVGEFDREAYFADGSFTRQMLEYAKEKGVDTAGENPNFEMFPYKVRIDMNNQDVYLNRKKIVSMRPKYVIDTVAAEQQRLYKASFNEQAFAAELEEGYELAILKAGKRPQSVILLNNVYKAMVPLTKLRKEYDLMSFSFDIARLYNSETRTAKSGRIFDFGTSKDGKTGIRILDAAGNEQFVSTIKFFEAEEE